MKKTLKKFANREIKNTYVIKGGEEDKPKTNGMRLNGFRING